MADGGRDDVLGQKALAAQRAFEARGMSPSKALRRALSRAADGLWDLALVCQSVSIEAHDQDGVIDCLSPSELLLLLDGPEGTLGLVAIERDVMTGLIEVQTIQQVSTIPFDPERPLTATDAAMMAPMIDATMERMADYLVDHPLHGEITGYRFGAMVEDSRTASLLLDAHGYRAFRAEVDLALGRRKGRVSIYLPEKDLKKGKGGAAAEPAGPGPHEDRLSRVPARLDAVLSRITMSLGQAGTLRPGDLLKLPVDVLDRVEVTAGRGQLVARGKLGQTNGMRAVRLTWPPRDGEAPGPVKYGRRADDVPGLVPGAPDFAGALAAPEPAGDFAADLPEIDVEPAEFESEFSNDFDSGGGDAALPDIDFAADAADFDLGEFDMPDDDNDIGLGDEFASAPMDFDFDEK